MRSPKGNDQDGQPAQPHERAFDHVLLVVFENQYRSYVLSNPYMRRLARQGIQLGSYFGVMHPSQTNYIASVAGALCNVTNDAKPPLIGERTIVDLLEEAPGRLRWKGYMESYVREAMPWTPELDPKDTPPYYAKHNPFASFSTVVRNRARWHCIDNEAGFFADVLNGELPEYAWFSPNMWSDGHWIDGTELESKPRAPGLVDQQARWLEGLLNRLRFPGPRSHLPPRTLMVITFDESDFEADYQPDLASAYDGPNQVYTLLLGNHLVPGFEEEGYNHYSLLRTIEVNYGLGHLEKNDADANWFQFLWDRRFGWSGRLETPLCASPEEQGPIAATGHAGAFFVAVAGNDGRLRMRTLAGDPREWSAETLLAIDGAGGIALASTFGELVLVARSLAGELQCMRYDLQRGWSAIASPSPAEPCAAVALTSFDRERRIMLALRGQSGAVTSHVWGTEDWGPAVAVPAAQGDGPIALGTLGASVHLVGKASGSDEMRVVSYNTAPFNVVTVGPNRWGGPQDDTTVDRWSPSAFPVAHFSARPDATGLRQPGTLPYRSSGPLAIATLDGVMHLVHPGPGNPLLMTETFSLSGLMTPSQPVSYKRADSPTASNGFGTLAEGGWSRQAPIFGASCAATGALAMARAGRAIMLLHRPQHGAPVELRIGCYRRSHD